MKSIKKYIMLLLIILVVIFIIQNTESVSVSFLLYEISMPRAFLLSLVLLVGIIIGVFLPFEFKKKRVE